MATNRSGHKPGGGLYSRQTVHTKAPKVEPRAYAKGPGGVSQFGQAQGNHITRAGSSNYSGDPVTRACTEAAIQARATFAATSAE
jgi:hypothetical protein